MADDGLGRGIEDISHLFLSARQKRLAAEAQQPAGEPDPTAQTPLVWPVVRTGELASAGPAPTWRMAWRLAPAGTHALHITVSAETTEVRWLGQADSPPTDRSAADLIDAADIAVIDLTDASQAVREQVSLAAGELVVLSGASEADCLATYTLIKDARESLRAIVLGLEIVGAADEVAAAWGRIRDAVGYFLKRPLIDWRERYPLAETETSGPEPTRVAAVPTESLQGALCGLASRVRRAPTPVPVPAASPPAAPAPPDAPAAAEPSPVSTESRTRPLLTWPDPDVADLADFIEQHPHLLQPDLVLVDRGLHATGQDVVDLLGRDSGGRAVVVLVSASDGAALLTAGLGYARWCLREVTLLKRLHGRLRIEAEVPPRLILAAPRFAEDVLEAVRTVRRPALSLIELHAYELEGERAVAVIHLA